MNVIPTSISSLRPIALASRPGVWSLDPASLVLPPLGVTAILWVTSANVLAVEAVLYALLLFLLPWGSFVVWRQQNRGGLPVFAMVGFAYWWYFALGMFWLDPERSAGVSSGGEVVEALFMALVGVVSIWLGMRVQLNVLAPSRQLELSNHPAVWLYVRVVLVLGAVGSLSVGSRAVLGAGGRNIMEISISTVPTVALMLLLHRCLTEKASMADRVLLTFYFPVMVVGALASGWLGQAVTLGLISGAMYVVIRRKVPWVLIALSVATVLFLQVGKKEFRNQYWYGEVDGGLVEKATFWMNKSSSMWTEALTSGGGDSARQLSAQSLERTSLLTQVVHVLAMTPSQIPFQGGHTYSYLAITLIPRFLWPDKPSVNQANQYYQVAFGLTDAKDLDRVSIAVGCLGEAYINFGWSGVIGIMFAIGILLGIYERAFVARDSTTLFLAIGIALLRGVLAVEAQMAQYLGGVLQQVLLTILVFLPVAQRRRKPIE